MADVRSKHHTTGFRLILFAWAVEILAAGVGLLIAGATGFSIRAEFLTNEGSLSPLAMTSIALGALPFVMVAIVELTKIPLAIGFYNAPRLRWRVVFGVTLLFLVFITFETALNGFERNFSNLTRTIQTKLSEIQNIEGQAGILEDSVAGADDTKIDDINTRYDNLIDEAEKNRQQRIAEIDKSISDQMGILRAGRIPALEQSIESLQNRINQAGERHDQKRQEIQANYTIRVASIRADYSKRIELVEGDVIRAEETLLRNSERLDERLRDIERRLKEMADEERIELAPAFFTKQAITEKWAERRAPLEAERAEIAAAQLLTAASPIQGGAVAALNAKQDQALADAEIKRDTDTGNLDTAFAGQTAAQTAELGLLNQQLAEAQGQTQGTQERQIEILQQQKNDAQVASNSEKDRHEKSREEELKAVGLVKASVEDLKAQRVILLEDAIKIRAAINDKVADNQVYRLTALWTGQDDVSKVTRDQLRITFFFWFGSLAMIVAVTGTVLAFAGLVLMDEKGHKKETGPIARSIRHLLVSRRKNINKPRVVEKEITVEKIVEVTKEVPVDRVVIRDVPREIVRRELVHVPLYTNEKSLLGVISSDPNGKKDDPPSEEIDAAADGKDE